MPAKEYNYCLDFIKGIACIFVVLMHCEFPGMLGILTQTVSRFCVPLFFMVSGYFCFKPGCLQKVEEKDRALILGKIKHIFGITLRACLFYTVFSLIMFSLGYEKVWTVSLRKIIYWITMNQPGWAGVAGQYWFLFALLYTYVLYGVVLKLKLIRQAYWLAGALFVVYVILAQGCHLAGIHVMNMVYRNWLIEGFPYFMLGHWIHHYQERLRLDNRIVLPVIFISTLLCIVERYTIGRDFGVNIVTIPQVFFLFLYAINNPTEHEGLIQTIGKRYSMFVYIIHPAVWHALEFAFQNIGIGDNRMALYSLPVLVVVLTLCLSHLVYTVNKRIKI